MTNEDLLWPWLTSFSRNENFFPHLAAALRRYAEKQREGGLIFETFVFTRINEECKAKN